MYLVYAFWRGEWYGGMYSILGICDIASGSLGELNRNTLKSEFIYQIKF